MELNAVLLQCVLKSWYMGHLNFLHDFNLRNLNPSDAIPSPFLFLLFEHPAQLKKASASLQLLRVIACQPFLRDWKIQWLPAEARTRDPSVHSLCVPLVTMPPYRLTLNVRPVPLREERGPFDVSAVGDIPWCLWRDGVRSVWCHSCSCCWCFSVPNNKLSPHSRNQ